MAVVLYERKLTVPPKTPETTPVEVSLSINEPWILALDLFFPAGCHGGVHVDVLYGIHRLTPMPIEQYISGDDATIQVLRNFRLPARGERLTIRGWSETLYFSHTIYIRVEAGEEEDIKPERLVVSELRRARVEAPVVRY